MNFTPYLNFPGNCEEAMTFYAKVLDGKILMMSKFSDEESCAGMPDEIQDKIMHAQLEVNDNLLMASDTMPQQYQKPQGVHISISFDDLGKARKAFDALAEGGEIQMKFEKTFWAAGFGMLRDRFDVLWMVNVDSPDSKYY